MKKIFTIFLVVSMVSNAIAQLQRADRYYNVGDFASAAENYTIAFENENHKEILTKLISSYYLSQDYANALTYLKLLVGGRFLEGDKSYDNNYNFIMYDVLNVKGNIKEAVDYLELYHNNGGRPFDKEKALQILKELEGTNSAFKIVKSNLSSESDDFGAVRVGDSIFFVSDRPSENVLSNLFGKRFKTTQRPFLDIYGVRVNDKNEFADEPVLLSKAINSKLHDGNFCFNSEGSEMFISRSAFSEGDTDRIFDEEGTNRVHLYKSVRIDGIWREAERLPFVRDEFSYMHPSLTRDGRRLYFSSDMDGGLGGFDIYYVMISLDGSYGTPVNLGPTINTTQRDQFPYVSGTGDLYYSTNGRVGLGMLDVFVAPLTVKGFTEPINLGAPINSKYDDFSFSYYKDNNGLVATSRNGTNDDIYSFIQNGDFIKREFNTLFEIRDAVTNELIPNAKIRIEGYQGKEIYNESKEAPSAFNIPLAVDDYTFIGSGDNYPETRMKIEVRGNTNEPYVFKVDRIFTEEELRIIDEKNLAKDLKEKDPSRFELLTDTIGPEVIEKDGRLYIDVAPIYFDFDLSVIREDSEKVLDELAKKLLKYEKIKLKIESHTDSRGPAAYNLPLSERRAKSTFDYLVSKGVNPSRLEYKGFGSSDPVVKCAAGECTDEQYQLNRRSEFEITGY
ncbi:OmpA family protein [Dokdonia sp. Hel_I_53]|uniref:OmpA family protein n=1 Tax=Dokdonia sp. Hel_I_53 TaxID=1566287 RepID=UPI00119D26F1|nr:OmpA family protein [Dokdonia sp. Hel_I_53]